MVILRNVSIIYARSKPISAKENPLKSDKPEKNIYKFRLEMGLLNPELGSSRVEKLNEFLVTMHDL